MAVPASLPGRAQPRHDRARTAACPLAARAHRPRDPRHHPGRPSYPREDREREVRCVSPPTGAACARLAAASLPRGMTADEYCQQKAASSGSSFYYSFLFLPAERRRAITALYAFCREVDDVVDEGMEAQIAATKLAWWRKEVSDLFAGSPHHPVMRALQPHLRFGITPAWLNEIIDGMEMDLRQTRYLDWAALETYCHRVAGVVGLLAAGIFGYSDARTLDYARSLG